MQPLRRSSRASKPVDRWIPPQPEFHQLAAGESHNENTADDEHNNIQPPAPAPQLILQKILQLACAHPNALIRIKGVCTTFNQTAKSHPFWRQYLVQHNTAFKDPIRLSRDYHFHWRHAVVRHAKNICERCEFMTNEIYIGRHPSQEFRRRLCGECFVSELSAFKLQHAAEYVKYAKRKLTQKKSLKLVSKTYLHHFVHHNTKHVRGFYYRYVIYEFPKDEVLMLRDFVQ
ncbi:hypothetical protein HDU98_006651 [Podochytrium sp. JEL0797]|nr:hypothetical protein HDU98_006651 [Podochytrium sp. JEL0797]